MLRPLAKSALDEPLWWFGVKDRSNGSQYAGRVGCFESLEESEEPIRLGLFIIVDEGDQVLFGVLECQIARKRNAAAGFHAVQNWDRTGTLLVLNNLPPGFGLVVVRHDNRIGKPVISPLCLERCKCPAQQFRSLYEQTQTEMWLMRP